MPFSLNYICDGCGYVVLARTIDGRVSPPPDLCAGCATLEGVLKTKRPRIAPGDIRLGLSLVSYHKYEAKWRVQCLFCLDHTLVSSNNIGVQKSCGCLKSGTLIVTSFNAGEETCECECKECGLTSTYSLVTGEKITCKSGC